MRRRRFALSGCALIAALFAWGNIASGGAGEPIDWHKPRVARGDRLALTYPRNWYATSNDGRDIVVASFPITKEWLARERRTLPDGSVLIWAFSYGKLPRAYDSNLPPRPRELRLNPKTFGFYECGLKLEGYLLNFRDHGLAVQVEVAFGAHTDHGAAVAVVNRLRVS